MDDRPFSRLLTVGELAKRTGLKPDTIRKWARRGAIPSRKAERLLLFDERELLEWWRGLPSTNIERPDDAGR